MNLGHTVGHAIEKQSDYTITHGHAVAIGMAVMTRTAVKNELCSCDDLNELLNALRANSLPTECPCGLDELINGMLSDKKRRGDSITLVVPEKIGKCILKKIPISDLEKFISSGLRE